MKRFLPYLGVVLLAAGTAFAQAPQGDAKPKPRRFDCSQAKDPKACEERLQKARAMRDKAREACKHAQGADRRDCMRRELCAQTADAAKCEARAKQHAERRAKLRQACEGKAGEALKSCIREQRRGAPKSDKK